MKSRFSLFLAVALAVPTLSPAAVVLVRGPVPTATVSGAGWGNAASEIASAIQARPGLAGASPLLGQVSGRLRLEFSLRADSVGALSFLAHMPVETASAEEFSKLPVSEQVRLLDSAISATAAELQPLAEALVTRAAQGNLSTDEQTALDEISQRWFFLNPLTAQAVQTAVAAQRAAKTLGKASRYAQALDDSNAIATVEAASAVNGAARLLDEAPAGSRVGKVLAPYVARALDEAETRAQERGVPLGLVYQDVIDHHMYLFGRKRDEALFNTLRKSGEWTEFVAAVSLHAAERMGTLGEAARNSLAKMAETDDLRLAIPSWHPLFGRYSSIAEWITAVHGKPDDAKDLTGLRLFTAFGTPVMAEYSVWPAIALYALTQFTPLNPIHLVQGATATVLLYTSLLAHEFGHTLAAKAFGIRTRKISLNFFGGGAYVVRGFRQALPEFVIALAGPVVSALCGGAAFLLAPLTAGTLLTPVLTMVASLNFLMAALNLLPILPLDGGRVLRSLLTNRIGNYRATKTAAFVGVTLPVLALLYELFVPSGLGTYLLLIGIWGWSTMRYHPGTITVDENPKSAD